MKRTGGEKVEKANIDISFEMFYYKEVQRRGNGVKKEFKMSNIEAGLQMDGGDPIKERN